MMTIITWKTDSIGIDRVRVGDLLAVIVPIGHGWQEWTIYRLDDGDTRRIIGDQETISEDCRAIVETRLRELTGAKLGRAA